MKKPKGFQKYWDEMRAYGADGFTALDISAGEPFGMAAMRKYVEFLWKAAYLRRLDQTRASPKNGRASGVYAVREGAPKRAPTPKTHGRIARYGQQQAHMWVAMRTLKHWTIGELAVAAATDDTPVTITMAYSFIATLKQAGAIATLRAPMTGGLANAFARPGVFRLKPSFNTGPVPPVIIRRNGKVRVYDGNRDLFLDELREAA